MRKMKKVNTKKVKTTKENTATLNGVKPKKFECASLPSGYTDH